MISAKLTGIDKYHEIKIAGPILKAIEVVPFMAYINYLAAWCLSLKFAGERQERGYVAAGPAPRQNYSWCQSIH